MEKFYLEEPTIERKNEAFEYLNEFVRFDSELNGTGSMDKCLDGWTYEEFLTEMEKRKDKDYAYSINRCPSKTFFLIRKNDNKIIGMINIRYDISQELLEKINQTGIGPGGLGGVTTALAVNINTYATHIAGLPVAINICCHVNRHVVREV